MEIRANDWKVRLREIEKEMEKISKEICELKKNKESKQNNEEITTKYRELGSLVMEKKQWEEEINEW